eukprot:TRINITY_DN3860_c9_g1_i1.p1 TRINITY_DN3860_c9_g1~~TRINITY_DN3860_c9_g1_i1.p1  ORF type:complete len:423 (-),score=142.83 TRINITY_DN3860_c9_g1_i1:280-1548(-)
MAAFRCSFVAAALFSSAQALKNLGGLSACACSCCETARPNSNALRAHNAALICSPLSDVDSQSGCPQECQDPTTAFQVASSTFAANEDLAGAMDYGSYCMQKCQPAENTGLSCFLTDAEKQATDARVALMGGAVEAVQAGDKADKAEALQSALLAKNDAEEDEAGLEETGAMVAEAEGKKASAMAVETKAAMAEAQAAQARATALVDLKKAENRGGIIADIQGQLMESSQRAHLFAQTALKASQQAAADLEALKHVHEFAAKEAAKMAVAQLNFEAQTNLHELDLFNRNLEPVPLPPVPEQIGKAASPYLKAAAQAGGVKQLFEAEASAKRDEAERLRFGAERTRGQAAAYEGNAGALNKIRASADKLLQQSQDAEGAALNADQEAERIGAQLPKYMGLAGQAVGRATVMGEQKWMPPAISS